MLRQPQGLTSGKTQGSEQRATSPAVPLLTMIRFPSLLGGGTAPLRARLPGDRRGGRLSRVRVPRIPGRALGKIIPQESAISREYEFLSPAVSPTMIV